MNDTSRIFISKKIAGGDLIYCPASTSAGANLAFCGYNQLMDKSEMIEHLKVVHAIATLPPRGRRAKGACG